MHAAAVQAAAGGSRVSDFPDSWAEVIERLAHVVGDEASAEEWIRQALEAEWGATERRDLPVATRALALQRLSGVVMRLEEEPYDVAFVVGQRDIVGRVFARYFSGAWLPGPPWRLDPFEPLPTHSEWAAQSDFGEVMSDAG